MTTSVPVRKGADAFRTISEVAEALKLPQHVLRFWETRFVQIKPLKRGGGRRFYRPEDVDLLVAIRHLLYGEGYTIRGVQRMLKELGPRGVASLPRTAAGSDRPDGDRSAAAPEHDTPGHDGSSPADDDLPEFLRDDAPPGMSPTPDHSLSPLSPSFGGDEVLGRLQALDHELAECRRILDAALG